MRTPLRAAAMACCVVLSMWAAPARCAEPTLGSKSTDQQVQAYVTYWMEALQSAGGDANAVLASRDKLVDGYKKIADKGGYTFAGTAASLATSMLSKGFGEDALGKVKEINLAMALSQMPQVSIQPALEALVVSKNAAVRYWAWKGYRDAREVLMGQSQEYAQKFLAATAKAAGTETSAPVLEQVFRMLEIAGPMPDIVKKDVWDLAQKETLSILEKSWRRWCVQVLAGDVETAEACRMGVRALAAHADSNTDKAQRTKMLQEIVDLGFCAAKAFGQEKQASDAFAKLMRECEAALNALTKSNKEFVKKALDDPAINANPDRALLWVTPSGENNGVMAWVDFLRDQGVKDPNFPASTSGPASAAATAPAAAPK